jgi:hypothetical protein
MMRSSNLRALLETRFVEICLEVFVVAFVVVYLEVERLRVFVLVVVVVRLKRLRVESAWLRVVRGRLMSNGRGRIKVRFQNIVVVVVAITVEAVETGLLVGGDVSLELLRVLELRFVVIVITAATAAVVLVPASPVLHVEVVRFWNVGPG